MPKIALAQIHSDASFSVGAIKRFETRPFAAPVVAPSLNLSTHVALFPLLRIGLSGHYDRVAGGEYFERASGQRTFVLRDDSSHLGIGPDVRVFSPYRSFFFKFWFYTGLHYARVWSSTSSGGYFEWPLGLGASYKLSKHIEIFAQSGVRLGFAPGGDYFDDASLAHTGKQISGIEICLGVHLEL